MMPWTEPMPLPPSATYLERRRQEHIIKSWQDQASDAFTKAFKVRECQATDHNLARMLRSTGERPERVKEMRGMIRRLAHGRDQRFFFLGWGVFDHGSMWCRNRLPVLMVGQPYDIAADESELLKALARYPTLRVALDDRPSFYGFGTHHVRIEVANPTTPYKQPRATLKTRAVKRELRNALAKEFEEHP